MASYVFRVTRPINELDAPTGSYVVYRPGHPLAEVQVVRNMPGNYADFLLNYRDRLQLVVQDPPVQMGEPLAHATRARLRRAPR